MGHKLGRKILQHERKEMQHFIRQLLVFDVNHQIPLVTSSNSGILSSLHQKVGVGEREPSGCLKSTVLSEPGMNGFVKYFPNQL